MQVFITVLDANWRTHSLRLTLLLLLLIRISDLICCRGYLGVEATRGDRSADHGIREVTLRRLFALVAIGVKRCPEIDVWLFLAEAAFRHRVIMVLILGLLIHSLLSVGGGLDDMGKLFL